MQKEIKNILVPVNFSEASNNALQTAIAMCKRHGAALHLLNVLETELLVPMAGMQVPAMGIASEMELSRRENLENMAKSVSRNHGIECHHYSETGFIPYIITTKAQDLACDLIVAGIAGPKMKKVTGIGNTMAIIRNAGVPVLTVPSGRRVLDFRNILFPVRPVLNALAKYKAAMAIIRKNKAKVLVMGLLNEKQGEKVGAVKEMVDNASDRMETEQVSVDRKLYFGKDIADEVVTTGTKRDIDLVVITATLKRGMKQFFVPGYVQRIINRSMVPVLCVKPAAGGEEYAIRTALSGARLL